MKWITLALLAACSGCGIIGYRTGSFGPPGPTVYPAVQVDVGMLRYGLQETSGVGSKLFLGTCHIIDLPISVITDTICLPYDAWRVMSRPDTNQIEDVSNQPSDRTR
jgi:uncharacterized protein YceK